jgi:4-nitrophenyl phosphatase/phosphoglycolate phosphatase
LTDAQEWAGNGSMVGAIKGCTGVEPTVVGKPGPLMIDYLCDKLSLDRNRICMVGDRLDTDILFGNDNGLKSLLVLSGVTTEEKLLSAENTITPDFYADSIVDFFMDEKVGAET